MVDIQTIKAASIALGLELTEQQLTNLACCTDISMAIKEMMAMQEVQQVELEGEAKVDAWVESNAAKTLVKQIERALDKHVDYMNSAMAFLRDARKYRLEYLRVVNKPLVDITKDLIEAVRKTDLFTKKIQVVNNKILLTTNPFKVYYEQANVYLDMAPVQVTLDMAGDRDSESELVRVYNINAEKNKYCSRGKYWHPHVGSGGGLCWGEGVFALQSFAKEYKVDDLLKKIEGILTTYNPDSPYVTISELQAARFSQEEREELIKRAEKIYVDQGEIYFKEIDVAEEFERDYLETDDADDEIYTASAYSLEYHVDGMVLPANEDSSLYVRVRKDEYIPINTAVTEWDWR